MHYIDHEYVATSYFVTVYQPGGTMNKSPMYHTIRELRGGFPLRNLRLFELLRNGLPDKNLNHSDLLRIGFPHLRVPHLVVLVLSLMVLTFGTALAQQSGTNSDTLFVVDFHMADDVVEREPIELVDSYVLSDERAWCFARIHNSDRMQDLYFNWYYEGELYFKMNTKVGVSTNWRTYSSVALQPGEWEVVLVNSQEKELARTAFLVSE